MEKVYITTVQYRKVFESINETKIKSENKNSSRLGITVPNNKEEAKVVISSINKKEQQLQEAVQWCLDNNDNGYKTLKTSLSL